MEFIDLKAQYRALEGDLKQAMHKVLTHAQFISGPEVDEFEGEMEEYIGVKHAISCGNGTDALQLLYMAYEIGPAHAVFIPDITFVATAEPAVMLGATPVICDVDMDSYNICPKSLERQVKAVIKEGKLLPKVVVTVDILGNPAEYDAIEAICKKYDMLLFADAAQSFGALYKGKVAGSFGDAAITSFFPAKPLGCYGDGGAVFTNDDEIADVIRSLAVHGRGPDGKYANIRVGMNSRLDTLQAAVLQVKLKAFEDYELERRQEVANYYSQGLKHAFKTPHIEEYATSAWAQYAVLADNKKQRDRIVAHLTQREIPNMVYYPIPQHQLPVYADLNSYDETFENAIEYCDTTFSLPMHPYLSQQEQDMIIEAVLEAIE